MYFSLEMFARIKCSLIFDFSTSELIINSSTVPCKYTANLGKNFLFYMIFQRFEFIVK